MAWFNPNDPSSAGLEWFPTNESSGSIASDSAMVAQTIEAQGTDTIDRMRWRTNFATTGVAIAEAYNSGSEVIGTISTATYNPNEDVTLSNVLDAGGATSSLYQEIDDGTTLNTADYITGDSAAVCTSVYPPTCHRYTTRFGTAGALAGKRILYVSLTVTHWGSLWCDVTDGSTTYDLGLILYEPAGYTTRTVTLYADPTKNQLWTPTVIQAFDAAYTWRFTLGATSDRFYRAYLTIGYCDENRLAWAYETPSTTGDQTLEFDSLVNPSAGSTFSRTNGNEYTYTLRRLPGGYSSASFTVPTLGSEPPIDDAAAHVPTCNSYGAITALGTEQDLGYPVTLRKTAGSVITSDGQPYYQAKTSGASVYLGNEMRQRITPASNTTYSLVRALVGVNTQGAISDISCGIYRASDNVQFGTTANVNRATFAALDTYCTIDGIDFKLVTFELPSSASLVGTTTYYAKFFSNATGAAVSDGTDSWQMLYLLGLDDEPGYNTSTGYVTVHGTNDTDSDMPVLFISAPTAPASITVAIANQTVSSAGGLCGTTTYQYAHVTWSATSLSGSFGHYEVQRSTDGGTTWELVCDNITTESDTTFDDYEGPRNVSAQYRVRAVRSDDAPSAWITSGGYTPLMSCAVAFVSNQDPTLNIVVLDKAPREYKFLNSADIIHHQLYARDYQVAFQPTEERGVVWEIPIVIYVAEENTSLEHDDGPGLTVFDQLRAISKADVAYVACLDSDGNVIYGSLKVPGGVRREPGKYYSAKVIVTQLTATPNTEPA